MRSRELVERRIRRRRVQSCKEQWFPWHLVLSTNSYITYQSVRLRFLPSFQREAPTESRTRKPSIRTTPPPQQSPPRLVYAYASQVKVINHGHARDNERRAGKKPTQDNSQKTRSNRTEKEKDEIRSRRRTKFHPSIYQIEIFMNKKGDLKPILSLIYTTIFVFSFSFMHQTPPIHFIIICITTTTSPPSSQPIPI